MLFRRTLKKHLTSSLVLARGCSAGRLFFRQYCRCHSLDSMLAISATSVSLLNPLILLTLLWEIMTNSLQENDMTSTGTLEQQQYLENMSIIFTFTESNSSYWVHFWHIQMIFKRYTFQLPGIDLVVKLQLGQNRPKLFSHCFVLA